MSESIKQTIAIIVEEISTLFSKIEEKEVKKLVKSIEGKRKKGIYLIGQGRSGLMARAFAIRLMHLGFNVFVAGETLTPAVKEGDLVIACSGSGETGITCYLADKAKKIGAEIVAIVAKKDSKLARIADTVVTIPAPYKFLEVDKRDSIQHPGSLFEQGLLLLLDAVVVLLRERSGETYFNMNIRHANLE